MRTTVAIDDGLLKTAKLRAEELGLTLGQLVEEALRFYLTRVEESAQFGPPLPVFDGGGGWRPDVDLTSNASMFDALGDKNAEFASRRLEHPA